MGGMGGLGGKGVMGGKGRTGGKGGTGGTGEKFEMGGKIGILTGKIGNGRNFRDLGYVCRSQPFIPGPYSSCIVSMGMSILCMALSTSIISGSCKTITFH